MKEILLSQTGKHKGKFVALVDDEDYERVNQFRWAVAQRGHTCYAIMRYFDGIKKRNKYMHHLIMDMKGIDHKDHNGLNCQKYNMRKCTHQQNAMNKIGRKDKSSKYKGVHWSKTKKKWTVQIKINSRVIYTGTFLSEEDAARAYDLRAMDLFGEFAYLNFP